MFFKLSSLRLFSAIIFATCLFGLSAKASTHGDEAEFCFSKIVEEKCTTKTEQGGIWGHMKHEFYPLVFTETYDWWGSLKVSEDGRFRGILIRDQFSEKEVRYDATGGRMSASSDWFAIKYVDAVESEHVIYFRVISHH